MDSYGINIYAKMMTTSLKVMAEDIFGANQGLGYLVNVTATLIAYDLVLINLSQEKMGAIT